MFSCSSLFSYARHPGFIYRLICPCLLQLLLALVSTYRYDGNDVNMGLAKSEAKIVHEAVRNGTLDHQELVRIVGTRSKAQLKATFSCFKDEHNSSITKVRPQKYLVFKFKDLMLCMKSIW